mgnify:CR=1 FL=1
MRYPNIRILQILETRAPSDAHKKDRPHGRSFCQMHNANCVLCGFYREFFVLAVANPLLKEHEGTRDKYRRVSTGNNADCNRERKVLDRTRCAKVKGKHRKQGRQACNNRRSEERRVGKEGRSRWSQYD